MKYLLFILVGFFVCTTIEFYKIDKEAREVENNPLPPPK